MNNYLERRNPAIDLLRALTMALMLMVNDFWSVRGIPHWMHHAARGEDMLGFSDLVFPTFLFCVGLSIPYAVAAMLPKGRSEGDVVRHILSRSFALIVMGAFICNYEYGIDPAVGYDRNLYCLLMTLAFFLIFSHQPRVAWLSHVLRLSGWAILLFLLISSRSPEGRTFYPYWWGILGLIGWAYLFCALVYALVRRTATQKSKYLAFLAPAGTATLTCYMLPYILYPLISLTVGWDWSYAIPEPFGLVKCVAFSALCITLTWLLSRCSVRLKI